MVKEMIHLYQIVKGIYGASALPDIAKNRYPIYFIICPYPCTSIRPQQTIYNSAHLLNIPLVFIFKRFKKNCKFNI